MSLRKNYFYNLFYQILVVILPLATAPYVSRVLGAEGIGIYSYTLSIASYFIMFGLVGSTAYGQREIAYAANDRIRRTKTFWEIFLLRLTLMSVSLLTFFIAFVLPKGEYWFYFLAVSVEIVSNIFDVSWFFQGLEEFRKTVIRNTAVKLTTFVLIFALVHRPEDLGIYILLNVFSTLLGNLSLWLYLPKYLAGRKETGKLDVWRHLKGTFMLFIPQVAISIYTVLDKTMIGSIIPAKSEVGFYEQSQKIVRILTTVVTSISAVMQVRVARNFAEHKNDQIEHDILKSIQLVYLLAFPIVFGLIMVADDFVPFFFGEGYDRVAGLMKVISPIVLMIGMSNVIGTQYLIPVHREKDMTKSVVAGSVVNFFMNLFLISNFGAFGAAVGTVIAETVVTATGLFVVRKDLRLRRIFAYAVQPLFCGVVMFLAGLLIGRLVPSPVPRVFIQAVSGAAVYLALSLLTKNPILTDTVLRLKKKLAAHKK